MLPAWFVAGIIWGWKRPAYSAVYIPGLVSFVPAVLVLMRPEVPALAAAGSGGLMWGAAPMIACLFGSLVAEAINPQRRDARTVKKQALASRHRAEAAEAQIREASTRINEILSALPSPVAISQVGPAEAVSADRLLQRAAEDLFVQRMRVSTARTELDEIDKASREPRD